MPMCMHAYIFLDVLALVFGTFLTSFLQDLLRRFLWVCLLSTLVASMASHCQTLVVWFPIFVCSLNCFPCGFFSMFAMGFLSSWNDKPTASCAFCFLRSLKWGVIFCLHDTLYKITSSVKFSVIFNVKIMCKSLACKLPFCFSNVEVFFCIFSRIDKGFDQLWMYRQEVSSVSSSKVLMCIYQLGPVKNQIATQFTSPCFQVEPIYF